jgi:hypothetical protein
MRGRERRQSWRLTRRELHKSLARAGRAWINEVWNATAGASARLSSLSPLTSVLGARLVETYLAEERVGGEEIHRAMRIAIVAGYGTRMVIVDPTEQPSLKPSSFQLKASSDVEQIASNPNAVNNLLEQVRTVAVDRFESVMTLPDPVWAAYVATATMKLQRQLATSTLTWRELRRARLESMLRYGYVLRCLDEALDAEPVLRDG